MTAVLLTIHIMIVLSLTGVVLLQRSDGSALGLGGGTTGGFMTGRGAASALTRTTSILAAAFFATSLILAIGSGNNGSDAETLGKLTGDSEEASTATDLDTVQRMLGNTPPENPETHAGDNTPQ